MRLPEVLYFTLLSELPALLERDLSNFFITHSFFQIFAECLLCTKQWSRNWKCCHRKKKSITIDNTIFRPYYWIFVTATTFFNFCYHFSATTFSISKSWLWSNRSFFIASYLTSEHLIDLIFFPSSTVPISSKLLLLVLVYVFHITYFSQIIISAHISEWHANRSRVLCIARAYQPLSQLVNNW